MQDHLLHNNSKQEARDILTPPQVSQLSRRSSDINSITYVESIQVLRHFAPFRVLRMNILKVNLKEMAQNGQSDVSQWKLGRCN